MVVSSGDISSRQLLLLECAHRKILRTLMGFPARYRVSALLGPLGAHSFASLISQRQLSFIHSFSLMSTDALPRCVLALRLANHGSGSVLHTWSQLLRHHSLPDIDEILASPFLFMVGVVMFVLTLWLRAMQLCQPSVLTFHWVIVLFLVGLILTGELLCLLLLLLGVPFFVFGC